jgi:hypothetical protein
VAVSSRAFAIYNTLQCALAVVVARRTTAALPALQLGFVVIGVVCLVAAAMGDPAEKNDRKRRP